MSKKFWDFLDDRVKGREKNVPWHVNDKLKAYKFLTENDIPTPKLLKVYDHPDEIQMGALPQNFCLKPSNMHSANGVLPLYKVTDQLYFDRLRKRFISEAAIFREQQRVFDLCQYKSTYKILVEESFGHPRNSLLIPPDYKFYTFGNKVGLIIQIDRNTDIPNIAFFNEKFEPLENRDVIFGNLSASKHGHAEIPLAAEKMLEFASRVPKLLNTPFVSVDMYSVKSGAFVGEITPAPGGPYYKKVFELLPEYDDLLGNMWTEALRDY